MMVWAVSSLTETTKVGSSSASFRRASDRRSWSALVFGSTATETTGLGNLGGSRMTPSSCSPIVSPVKVFFRPMAAHILPAVTSSSSSLEFACILSRRPIRSRPFLVRLLTTAPALTVPE